MCLTPVYIPSGYVEVDGMRFIKYRKVPCGKCLECLQKKQVEQTVLAIEESKKYDTQHFFTLTYAPENVPISVRHEFIDIETGEVEGSQMREYLKKNHRDNRAVKFIERAREKQIREQIYKNGERNRHCYVITREIPCDKRRLAVDTYFLSLRREDVKKWLKKCRRLWEYAHPNDKLNFSYYGAGEYGSQTWRPHYHFQFFGLTDEQALFFSNEWQKQYGYVDCETIDKGNSDSTLKVSQYVAKYICKIPVAFLDNEEHQATIENKNIEKSRKQGSLNYGISDDFENIKLDILAGYNTTEYNLDIAKEIIKNKAVYHYAGNTYPIPRKLKDKVFKESSIKGLRITPLRQAINDIMEVRFTNDFTNRVRQIITSSNAKGEDTTQALENMYEEEKQDRRNRAAIKKHNILKRYSKSKIK